MEYATKNITEQEYEELVLRGRKIQLELASTAIEERRVVHEPSEPWEFRALCAQTGPDAFYPEKGITSKDAKKICGRCAVVSDCLEVALARDADKDYGVWGNTTEHERRKIRRQRKQQAQREQAA